MNSEFEKFANEVKNHVFENVGDRENLDISLHHTQKLNGAEQISLTVRHKDSNIAPSIRLAPWFENYQNGESMDNIVHSIENGIVSHTPTKNMDISYIADFEKVKDQIMPKMVNKELNKELLSRVPHYDFGDLSVLFYLKLNSPEIGGGQVTITNQLFESWEVNDKQLMDASLENSNKSTHCQDILGVLFDINSKVDEDMAFPPTEVPMVLTNEDKLFGAPTIFNTDVMKGLCEKFGGEVVIIPSSVHETLILPDEKSSMQEKTLNSMVHEVNSNTVSAEDFLSDHIYHFDGEKFLQLNNDTMEKMELISAQTGKKYSIDDKKVNKSCERDSTISKLDGKQGIVNLDDHKNNKRNDIAL